EGRLEGSPARWGRLRQPGRGAVAHHEDPVGDLLELGVRERSHPQSPPNRRSSASLPGDAWETETVTPDFSSLPALLGQMLFRAESSGSLLSSRAGPD